MKDGHSYGRAYAAKDEFPMSLYSLSLDTLETKHWARGIHPMLEKSTGRILFQQDLEHSIYSLDLTTGTTTSFFDEVKVDEFAVSPDGRVLLLGIPHSTLFMNSSFLTVTSVSDPSRRFILEDNSRGNFRWVGQLE